MALDRNTPGSDGDDHRVASVQIEAVLPAEPEIAPRNSRNHRIIPNDTLVPGGSASRIAANIAAIRLLKQLHCPWWSADGTGMECSQGLDANAFYTSSDVVQAMWGMVEKLGFRGGRVIEPSAGTGLFFWSHARKNGCPF